MNEEKVYLWVNLIDLSEMGTIGKGDSSFGSPLNFFIMKRFGDELLPGSYFNPKMIDETYVIIECTPQRAEAIKGGLSVQGPRKIGREIRTKVTAKLPGKTWHYAAPPKW
jgi:hypothetical protein